MRSTCSSIRRRSGQRHVGVVTYQSLAPFGETGLTGGSAVTRGVASAVVNTKPRLWSDTCPDCRNHVDADRVRSERAQPGQARAVRRARGAKHPFTYTSKWSIARCLRSRLTSYRPVDVPTLVVDTVLGGSGGCVHLEFVCFGVSALRSPAFVARLIQRVELPSGGEISSPLY